MKKLLKLFLFWSVLAAAQVSLMPLPETQFFDSNGKPLAGGLVYTYQSGTTTPLATYTDLTGSVPNPDPVVLNSGGFGTIWLQSGQLYRIKVTDALGNQVYVVDGVSGIQGSSASNTATTSTVSFSPTPTFTALGQQQLFQITLTGNVTSSTLVMTGLPTPSIVTFRITQDNQGLHSFAWPPNVTGADPIGLEPNSITTQEFVWDGTQAWAWAPTRDNGLTHDLPGEVRMYAGTVAPAGWLLCQGEAVSRTTFASLFSVIGTTYGAGDGSTTFNLPDLRGRAPIGAGSPTGLANRCGALSGACSLASAGGEEAHTLSTAEIPAHSHAPGSLAVSDTHTWTNTLPSRVSVNTALIAAGGTQIQQGSTNTTDYNATYSVSGITGSTGGGGSHNNMEPFLVLNYICKY